MSAVGSVSEAAKDGLTLRASQAGNVARMSWHISGVAVMATLHHAADSAEGAVVGGARASARAFHNVAESAEDVVLEGARASVRMSARLGAGAVGDLGKAAHALTAGATAGVDSTKSMSSSLLRFGRSEGPMNRTSFAPTI